MIRTGTAAAGWVGLILMTMPLLTLIGDWCLWAPESPCIEASLQLDQPLLEGV